MASSENLKGLPALLLGAARHSLIASEENQKLILPRVFQSFVILRPVTFHVITYRFSLCLAT